MKAAVVTGANGFIGRVLVQILLDKGVEVYAICRQEFMEGIQHNCLHIIKGDLLNYEVLKEKIKSCLEVNNTKVDVFYHLAWAGVKKNEQTKYSIQILNLDMSMNAIRLCKEINCFKFVYGGTVAEYVSCDGLINEIWAPSPADMYGAMKVAVRYLVKAEAELLGIGFVSTILCSTYGEHRIDDNIISYTIKELLQGHEPIYGNLEQMWDFLYVEDAAFALYLIGEKGNCGSTYSIGSGQYRHLHEYVLCIRDIIAPSLNLKINILNAKYRKVLNSCIDSFLLQRDTGFHPKYTFEEGVQRTISWYKKNIDWIILGGNDGKTK